MFPAYFLVLLLNELRSSRQARCAAAISGALAAGLVFALPPGLALIGASGAALLGLTDLPRETN
ncbi:MAG: hypothetical protein ACRDYB_10355 [Acidimicrobiales bacterium]